MAYTVLARRYRSGTFDEVIGQEHVAQTLKKAIESDRIAHAFLFNGTRGVGKTSMARILAKALNCRSSDGPTPKPCGKCDSCTAIARGDDIDVLEIDAASNTGVDNVREVIENSQYRPALSRFKIYIIDEAHMLSKAAFNALLKTLEEPPSHVKFILATTEPEKILPTILSRCQRYDFRNIPTREIAAHLKAICKSEKIQADEDALLLVAKAGAGSMRDALSLLDRLLSIGEKKLTVEQIEHMLGLPRSQLVFDLAQRIGDGDVKAALTQASEMVQAGLSVDSLIAALVDHLRNLLILRTCGRDSELVEVPGLSMDELVAQAERFDPVALSQDIAILEELRRQVRTSQAGRALLDATIVRMTLSDQFASIGDLMGRLDGHGGSAATRPPARTQAAVPRSAAAPPEKKKADEGVTGGGAEAPVAAPAPSAMPAPRPVHSSLAAASPALTVEGSAPASLSPAAASPALAVASSAPAVTVQDPFADEDDDLPAVGRVWEGPKVSLGALLKQHAASSSSPSHAPAPAASIPAHDASNVVPVDPNDLPRVWQQMLALLSGQAGLLGMLTHAQLASLSDGQAVVRYGPQHGTFVKMLEKNGKKDLIRDAASQVLQQPVGVRFEVDESLATTEEPKPAARAAPPVRPPPKAAPAPAAAPQPALPPPTRVTPELVEALRAEQPLVKALMEGLGATIIRVEE